MRTPAVGGIHFASTVGALASGTSRAQCVSLQLNERACGDSVTEESALYPFDWESLGSPGSALTRELVSFA